MKVKNIRGDEYRGTIGKATTASKWKRVHYLRKWAATKEDKDIYEDAFSQIEKEREK